MDITYWSFVHPERGEGIRENWVDWWDHFNRVHKNMVQHQRNNISIYHSNASFTLNIWCKIQVTTNPLLDCTLKKACCDNL